MHFPARPKDLFDIPALSKADVQLFNPTGTAWQTWTKPKGVTECFMMAISGGGGGAGGQSGGNSGGGGGGAGSISRLVIPAFFLPEQLYVQVGFGGRGGGVDAVGAAGNLSYISLGHSTGTPNVVLGSGAAAPGGGTNGSGGRTGGASGSVYGGSTFTTFGHFTTSAVTAIAGGAGGQAAVGTSINVWDQATAANNLILSPGAGGCGSGGANGGAQLNRTGGNTLDLSFLGIIAANTAVVAGGVSATNGGAGNPGLNRLQPFMQTGGSGGGYGTAGTGGRGGDGGYGCGGGGGGAGSTTGAGGGNGGPGLVMIISW